MVGDFQSAISTLTEAVRLAGPVPLFEANLGYAWARAGERSQAEAILDGFSRGQFARVVSPVERALVWLGLGEAEAALTGLEDACAARTPRMLSAGDPFFSELATESRYRELMARLRLPVQG